jgi:hypothetical protein
VGPHSPHHPTVHGSLVPEAAHAPPKDPSAEQHSPQGWPATWPPFCFGHACSQRATRPEHPQQQGMAASHKRRQQQKQVGKDALMHTNTHQTKPGIHMQCRAAAAMQSFSSWSGPFSPTMRPAHFNLELAACCPSMLQLLLEFVHTAFSCSCARHGAAECL